MTFKSWLEASPEIPLQGEPFIRHTTINSTIESLEKAIQHLQRVESQERKQSHFFPKYHKTEELEGVRNLLSNALENINGLITRSP